MLKRGVSATDIPISVGDFQSTGLPCVPVTAVRVTATFSGCVGHGLPGSREAPAALARELTKSPCEQELMQLEAACQQFYEGRDPLQQAEAQQVSGRVPPTFATGLSDFPGGGGAAGPY